MTAMQLTVPADSHAITWTREIAAPPAAIFAVMMDAEAIPKWWGPAYLTTDVLEHDPRTGGSWHYVQHDPEGNTYGFRGVFHEVVPAVRAVQTFEFEGMPGHVSLDTLVFEDLGDGRTLLSGTSVFQSIADRDGMVSAGMESGMTEGYDRLEALVLAGL